MFVALWYVVFACTCCDYSRSKSQSTEDYVTNIQTKEWTGVGRRLNPSFLQDFVQCGTPELEEVRRHPLEHVQSCRQLLLHHGFAD